MGQTDPARIIKDALAAAWATDADRSDWTPTVHIAEN